MTRPETPLLAADVIIELVDRSDRPIVLIKRKYSPVGWAIPGGFVDIGESVEQAAVREAREETALEVTLTKLLGIYSNPGRDPRGHTASVVFIAEASGQPSAQDDAADIAVFDIQVLPDDLVFDHNQILADYVLFRRGGYISGNVVQKPLSH
ncbi:MAG: NUDIX hydrolase [Gammaproteobacteria bacterium]|nr:MAG: NUDIX hydrolase [Gammaproteobacteria bacterium]